MSWYKIAKSTNRIGIINAIVNSDIDLFSQKTNYSCGAAVIKNLLLLMGHDLEDIPTEKELSQELESSKLEGTSISDMQEWLNKNNIKYYKMPNDEPLEYYLRKNLIVLVLFQDFVDKLSMKSIREGLGGHFALMVGYDNDSYYFVCSGGSRQIKKIEKHNFLERWKVKDINNGGFVEKFGLIFPL